MGEGIVREFGTDMYTQLHLNGLPTRTYCTAQGNPLSATWPVRWQGSLRENGYMSLLST